VFKKILFIACINIFTFGAQDTSCVSHFENGLDIQLKRLENFKKPELLKDFIKHLNEVGFKQMTEDSKWIFLNNQCINATRKTIPVEAAMLIEFIALGNILNELLKSQHRLDRLKKIISEITSEDQAFLKSILS
jgi:hypothetical protein